MKVFWDSKFFRTSMGVIFLAAGAFVTIPYLYKFNSLEAIINSKVMVITSPIEGIVDDSFNLKKGDILKRGEHLIAVRNGRINESFLNELITENRSLLIRVQALQKQITSLISLKDNLINRRIKYRKYTLIQIAAEILRAKSELTIAILEYKEARRQYERRIPLHKKKIISTEAFDKSKNQMYITKAKVKIKRNTLKLIVNNNDSVQDNTYVGIGRNDVPYTAQRLDELTILLADVAARISEYNFRADQIDRQIGVETKRLTNDRMFIATAPFKGVVWRKFVDKRSNVVIGENLVKIVNCETIFIEAIISNSRVNEVSLGEKVKIRMFGGDKIYPATVVRKYGSAMKIVDVNEAALLPDMKTDEFKLIMLFDGNKPTSNSYCNVGRRVIIEISRKFSPIDIFRRIVSAAKNVF